MSALSSMENAIKSLTSGASKMNLVQIEALVQAIVAAAPAIEEGIVSIEPYVAAIVTMVQSGGAPSDAQWAALEASIASGSATLQAAADAAQQEIQQSTNSSATE